MRETCTLTVPTSCLLVIHSSSVLDTTLASTGVPSVPNAQVIGAANRSPNTVTTDPPDDAPRLGTASSARGGSYTVTFTALVLMPLPHDTDSEVRPADNAGETHTTVSEDTAG